MDSSLHELIVEFHVGSKPEKSCGMTEEELV
jgi:hypothetical protein